MSYSSENDSSPEISVDYIQLIVGTFSNVSLDSFFKIQQDYLWISNKECNSSKLLHVFFRIHILFCSISGEFSLNSEWPTNAEIWISNKECNSSKLLHVFFRIHILFCAISGQFSSNSEWPTNAEAFVGHSLVS